MDNTSAQGKGSAVPEEIKGLSWGGFFWNWIWAVVNNAGLLWILIGFFFSPVASIFLLIKGNELAWQNKRWDSVEAFKSHQRKWAIAGLILIGFSVAIACISTFLLVILSASSSGS